jgi:hypothetical protein
MSNAEHWRKLREAATIREWSKELLVDYVKHFVGEDGWDKIGASHPDQIIDIIFSQIQVTLLGYAKDVQEADAKREAIDRMLQIRKD